MSHISTTGSAQATTSCAWETSDPQYVAYHNEQWGKPVFDSQELFAKLCLDGQQAGLSWLTILRKQKNYEKAFHQFNPKEIVKMTEDDVMNLMQDRGIVRNKLKIKSIIKNAHAYLYIEEVMPFNLYLWQFTQYRVIQNNCKIKGDVATTSAASYAMANALKKAGFSFVGSTICYAFMQAVGMVNDHLIDCYRHAALKTTQEQVEEKLVALQRSHQANN
nr:DNA-3-methyladenine glycosylase I [uncultured Glaciecola sp.]